MKKDFSDVDFNLVRNHIQIKSGNQLQTNNPIDRDSIVLSYVDGVINLWIKAFYLNIPFICNYYKVI